MKLDWIGSVVVLECGLKADVVRYPFRLAHDREMRSFWPSAAMQQRCASTFAFCNHTFIYHIPRPSPSSVLSIDLVSCMFCASGILERAENRFKRSHASRSLSTV